MIATINICNNSYIDKLESVFLIAFKKNNKKYFLNGKNEFKENDFSLSFLSEKEAKEYLIDLKWNIQYSYDLQSKTKRV